MLATTLTQAHSVTVGSFNNVQHLTGQVLERHVKRTDILDMGWNPGASLQFSYVHVALMEAESFLEFRKQ
jgi:hypothetical protein